MEERGEIGIGNEGERKVREGTNEGQGRQRLQRSAKSLHQVSKGAVKCLTRLRRLTHSQPLNYAAAHPSNFSVLVQRIMKHIR